MTQERILANATLVLPGETQRGAVQIVGEEIKDISSGSSVPAGAEDCDGDFVSPGLIELHTDNLERHIQPRPKVDWPHNAPILAHDAELASVGITTVFDAMRVGSIPTRPSLNSSRPLEQGVAVGNALVTMDAGYDIPAMARSEEHTSELQSRPHISYAVFCLKKKNHQQR